MANRVHTLKILKDYADSIIFGDKNFEVRYNDRGFQKGDIVKFKVIDKRTGLSKAHEIENHHYEITYVLGSFVGLAPDYVAFGIKEQDLRESGE